VRLVRLRARELRRRGGLYRCRIVLGTGTEGGGRPWLPSALASRGSREVAVRLAVIACVALATALGALRLDEVLGLFDWRADRNAARGYVERLYADEGIAGSRSVVEDAIAWMPTDARYRVLVGPHMSVENNFTRLLAPDFLRFLLLPRRQTQSASAEWLFCYGCDAAELPGRFEVLSNGGNGVRFGRLRP
jgi:hypothetical protein